MLFCPRLRITVTRPARQRSPQCEQPAAVAKQEQPNLEALTDGGWIYQDSELQSQNKSTHNISDTNLL